MHEHFNIFSFLATMTCTIQQPLAEWSVVPTSLLTRPLPSGTPDTSATCQQPYKQPAIRSISILYLTYFSIWITRGCQTPNQTYKHNNSFGKQHAGLSENKELQTNHIKIKVKYNPNCNKETICLIYHSYYMKSS